MPSLSYATTDDYPKTAGFIILQANAIIRAGQVLIKRPRFFKRATLANELAPAMEFCQSLIEPANSMGENIARDPVLAESYCRRTIPAALMVAAKTWALGDNVAARKKLDTAFETLLNGSAKFLTKKSHDECWLYEGVKT